MRTVPWSSERSDQLRTPDGCPAREAINPRSPDGCPAGEGPTSNFNRRTWPEDEGPVSTPSIRPALVAKDQRQTPHCQHSLVGDSKRVSKKWGRVLTASASVSSWHCRSTPRWSPAVLHSPCSADGSVPAMQMFSQPPIFAATPRTDGCLSDASQSPAPNPIQT